jgi:hypothetical protein
VFFEDGDGNAFPRKKETKHDPRWASADDAAGGRGRVINNGHLCR